ncbi:hypothetical protein VNO78_12458 [Psophocarpus tetragonolobus]|uniref:Uncharacterized protein n=1 Tax=Psophocarpus tetragonolobus TaxID=3891 RepID=A0AAN9XPK3_PSOTE
MSKRKLRCPGGDYGDLLSFASQTLSPRGQLLSKQDVGMMGYVGVEGSLDSIEIYLLRSLTTICHYKFKIVDTKNKLKDNELLEGQSCVGDRVLQVEG